LGTRTNTVISANTAAASKWDFGFQTFGEAKLCEMLGAAKDFIRDMAIGTAHVGFRSWGAAAPAKLTWPAASLVFSFITLLIGHLGTK
jgi:hypothetical protein